MNKQPPSDVSVPTLLIVAIWFMLLASCSKVEEQQQPPSKFKKGDIVYILPDYRKGQITNIGDYLSGPIRVRYFVEHKGYVYHCFYERDLSPTPEPQAEQE